MACNFEFIEDAEELIRDGNEVGGISLLYQNFERLNSLDEFDKVEEMLKTLKFDNHTYDSLLTILTASKWYSDSARNHRDFFKRVKKHFKKVGLFENDLLTGLN